MTYFEYKKLSEFTEKDLEQIHPFTFPDGKTLPILISASMKILKSADKYILTILKHDFRFILGWSLLYPRLGVTNDQYAYMCFVRPLFRKLGFGKKIFEETSKQFMQNNKIIVYGWDEKSKAFYSKIKNSYINDKEIEIL